MHRRSFSHTHRRARAYGHSLTHTQANTHTQMCCCVGNRVACIALACTVTRSHTRIDTHTHKRMHRMCNTLQNIAEATHRPRVTAWYAYMYIYIYVCVCVCVCVCMLRAPNVTHTFEHTFDRVVCVGQYAANSTPHCNALQHTAPHCTTLRHIAPHCNTPEHQHLIIYFDTDPHTHAHVRVHICTNTSPQSHAQRTQLRHVSHFSTLQHTACITRTASHTTHLSLPGSCSGLFCVTRDTLQHTATLCNTLQHTATHCNTLQHTATHCNTLQRTTLLPCSCSGLFCERGLSK